MTFDEWYKPRRGISISHTPITEEIARAAYEAGSAPDAKVAMTRAVRGLLVDAVEKIEGGWMPSKLWTLEARAALKDVGVVPPQPDAYHTKPLAPAPPAEWLAAQRDALRAELAEAKAALEKMRAAGDAMAERLGWSKPLIDWRRLRCQPEPQCPRCGWLDSEHRRAPTPGPGFEVICPPWDQEKHPYPQEAPPAPTSAEPAVEAARRAAKGKP